MAAFLSSADPADRLLDVELRAQQIGGPFGSWGFARLRSPVEEICSLAAMELSIAAIDAATVDDVAVDVWQDLLQFYGDSATEIGFHESVERFIVEIARIAEDEVDHLFDRIHCFRNEKEIEWQDLLTEFERADRLNKADYADNLIRFIDEAKAEFHRASTDTLDMLLYGDPDAPDEAGDGGLNSDERREVQQLRGVLWLLKHFVLEPFIDAGAIASLKLWLSAFRIALAQHRDSLARNERALHTGSSGQSKELDAALESLRETAADTFDRLLSALGGGKYLGDSEAVVQQCRDSLDAGMWEIAISAVERFYDKLRDEVVPWADAAKALDIRLNEMDGGRDGVSAVTGTRGRWMKSIADIELQLSRSRRPVGYDLVVGDIGVARRVIAQLEASEGSNPRVILRAFGDRFRRGFDLELRQRNSEPVFGSVSGRGRESVDVDVLLRDMETYVRDLVLDEIAHLASLETLLSEEARVVVADYEKIVVPALRMGTLRLRPEALEAQARFQRVFPVSAMQVHQIIEGGAPERHDEAIRLALHDAVRQLAEFAVAQWAIDHYAPDGAQPSGGLAFINYGRQTGERFRSVLSSMGQRRADASQSIVRAQETEYASPHTLECVRVELGGHLDMLELSQEVRAYQDCRDRRSVLSRNFSPHTTHAYEEAGLRWLESRRYLTESESMPRGALLVALAEFAPADAAGLLGWIDHAGSGTYRWKREVELGRSDVGRSFVEQEHLTTSGLADLIDRLNGDTVEGRELDALLCDLLWADLKTWLTRGAETLSRDDRMTPRKLADRLGRQAAQIRRDSQSDSTLHRLRRQQADQLQRFARTVATMEPPFERPAILTRRDW